MPGKQDLIRKDNIIDIIKILRSKQSCAVDLAKELKISTVAVSKIIAYMKNIGAVEESGNLNTVCGRKPVLLKLNRNFAMIAVVVLNESATKIYFVSVNGQFVDKIIYPDTEMFVSRERIKEIEQDIKNVCKKNADIPLISIVFSASGKINCYTGEIIYAQKIEDFRNVNFKKFFENIFHVPVIVCNDVHLAMEGEASIPERRNIMNNTLYLYIDKGMGSALMLDGKIVYGSSGLAGEIGLFDISAYETAFCNKKIKLCNNYVALNAMVNMYQCRKEKREYELNYDKTEEEINEFISLYQGGNELAREIVHRSAACLGGLIYSFAEFLNFDNVILTGGIKKMGEEYRNVLMDSINNNATFLKVDVDYSILDNEAIVIGAINRGIMVGIENYFTKK